MNVLEEAATIVGGDRQRQYGTPEEALTKVAALWSVILEMPITAQQVTLCMIAGKLARLSVSPEHRDSQIDICGYARILEMICENCKKNTASG